MIGLMWWKVDMITGSGMTAEQWREIKAQLLKDADSTPVTGTELLARYWKLPRAHKADDAQQGTDTTVASEELQEALQACSRAHRADMELAALTSQLGRQETEGTGQG